MVGFSRVAILSLAIGSTLAQNTTLSGDSKNTTLSGDSKNATLSADEKGSGRNDTVFAIQSKSDDKKKRLMNFKATPHKITVQSQLASTTSFKYAVSNSGFPRLRSFMYEKSEDSAFKYSFAVGLLRIIEINDTIGLKESQSFVNLQSQSWTPFQLLNETYTLSDGTKANLSAISTTLTTPNNATVKLSIYVTPNDMAIPGSGATLRPNQIKYGLEVNNFKYQYANSSLSFVKAIYAEADGQHENKTDKVSLGAAGAFTWNSTLELGGTGNTLSKGYISAAVFAAKLNDEHSYAKRNETDDDGEKTDPTNGKESAKIMVFNVTSANRAHIHASKLIWDPEMTVDAAYTGDKSNAFRKGGAIGLTVFATIVASVLLF